MGETGRKVATRLEEHETETDKITEEKKNYTRSSRKLSQSECSKSAGADHAVKENHVIDWSNTTILEKDNVHQTRLIREAIWIRRKSVMNRDEGANYLSHVYDPLIQEAPTAPSTQSSSGQRSF